MLQSKDLNEKSPSNTYVIPVYANGQYTEIKFKKFTLPKEYENFGATWYFYNRLDLFSCGGEAFPIEYYNNIETIN